MRSQITKKIGILMLFALVGFIIFTGTFITNHSVNLINSSNQDPNPASNPQLYCSSGNNMTISAGEEYYINWSVVSATNLFYEVVQINEEQQILLNFGTISSDLLEIRGKVNTNEIGNFLVRVRIYNTTLTIVDEIYLTIQSAAIQPNLFTYLIIGLGSVAVVLSTIPISMWWRNHKHGTRSQNLRNLENDASTQLFLSRSSILQLLCIEYSTGEVLCSEVFHDETSAPQWREECFRVIKSLQNKTSEIKNLEVYLEKKAAFLNTVQFPTHNLAILMLAEMKLQNPFLTSVRESAQNLILNNVGLIHNKESILEQMINTLGLDFSYYYQPTILSQQKELTELHLSGVEFDDVRKDLDHFLPLDFDRTTSFIKKMKQEYHDDDISYD